ncbi:DNA-binding transcriptional LysR family regulator [Clostridium saccharoperbutylacetonicum]|uniref:Transcriptional regulator LysR family n=1 Tax=Clostridium saccharoperbutylacetonicum N1-4(HMT) TaxID=931276 RepID=M1LYB5_9CLOT|nr:LysR family transcriptional regulator [Clostridium saccharoperbutylacetonicum]AGF58235.1 transcriptional regulator LysR family [Clostridium saccharoperbutylacetonicum N1-4(HMT)]NRT60988.1 DNA-binding transcriptional LysR family regulator [Clostridium saccharoperbutylacetonicum]NSB24302.1 DNA-binding transcriptional LysR family regulator [Clostridium saccharoperbutylacetonicum]NSB43679.1 DNA-binding transcriptional LysR family regulator [Clostridium saccharoperbutylacetonicum]
MLDFRINTFLTVCEYMNFTKAAEILCITQPAVSQHIKYLETVYNSKLFEYEGKKIRLTKAGKLLYQTSITMKHDEEYLKGKIKEEQLGITSIKFGATLTIGEFILPAKLNSYLNKNKNMKITMIVENTKELLYRLEHGEIDFALVEGYFIKSEYDYVVYSKENYICVTGKNYKLKKQPQVLEDLLGETLIVREKGSGTRDIFEKNLEEQNLTINDFSKVIEIGNINSIKYLVKNNHGITALYEAAVKEELENGSLQKVEVSDLQKNHKFYFIWRKNSTFEELYLEILKEFQ